jgi:hypothetical protein
MPSLAAISKIDFPFKADQLISFVILFRIGELLLSKRNEKWLIQNGAVEYGKNHYPFIVTLHSLFISSLIIEYSIQKTVSNVKYKNNLRIKTMEKLLDKTELGMARAEYIEVEPNVCLHITDAGEGWAISV